MSTIRIKNVGPIKEIELNLRRVNIFLGPQSTGKSTIAKIISQALWAEKNFITMGEKYDFYNGLIEFHHFDKNYFIHKDLEITFDSPWCTISMRYEGNKRNPQTSYQKKKNKELYQNAKIEYIPAERNFVSSITNITKYTSPSYDSIRSFLGSWHTAKVNYQRSKSFKIALPDLRFSYRHIESQERDIIKTDDGIEIDLQSASSGQQAILPLLLVGENVTQSLYDNKKVFSITELKHIERNVPSELLPLVEILNQMGRSSRTKTIEKEFEKLWSKLGYRAEYGCTHLIIEEPEQNLYPSTQRGLIEQLIKMTNDDKKHCHTLTLTTHSPFILYALNNCMLAGSIKGKEDALSEVGIEARISPKDVGIWLVGNGGITSIQDEQSSLLNQNFFNDEFQKMHNTTFQLLLIKD